MNGLMRFLVFGLTLSVGAGSLIAQESRLAGRLDSATQRRVEQLIGSALADELPTEPLVDKALEGASKGAPGDQIVQAVARLLADIQVARSILGGEADDYELLAGAGAVRAGASAERIETVVRSRPNMSSLVPLAVLTDLVALGVPPGTAASAVLALTESGASDAELDNLLRNVSSDIQAGYPPVQATAIRSGSPSIVPPPGGVLPPAVGIPPVAAPVRDQ